MINRLQSLFNRLAGVSDYPALSRNGQGLQSQSFADLEKPACWRRRARKLAQVPARRCRTKAH
ncbi:MAG: hypothetical protein H6R10_3640 [Rhodocyclaceae bacterium]|nr:hypothetical protein [Rhodocyclaceae bacterium]